MLVAVAVIMVPEMFSGSGSRPESPANDATTPGQLQTYRIELQSGQRVPQEPAVIEAPADKPQDELPTSLSDKTGPAVAASSSASSTAVRIAQATPDAVNPGVPANPASPKPDPAAPASKPATGDWAVQVGSFGTQDKAQQIASTLKAQGHSAFVVPVKVGGKTFYRVRVGGMTERSAADSTLRKLQSAYPGASVVPANR
ncbi:MAG: SPOR domain-containing protein [Steroidobacteraceae bacterium]